MPKEAPHSLVQGVIAACLIGLLAGSISSMTGEAIYRAKAWRSRPALRLACGALTLVAASALLARIAAPSAAFGPGAGAIRWVEAGAPAALTILAVAVLRALSTAAASAAGGCGGLFVPFLAVGDLAGRVFAVALGVPGDLAGSAGAACGIAAGYRLPFTALALVLGQGGPPLATLTGAGAVVVAGLAAIGTEWVVDRVLGNAFELVERRSGWPPGTPAPEPAGATRSPARERSPGPAGARRARARRPR